MIYDFLGGWEKFISLGVFCGELREKRRGNHFTPKSRFSAELG